MPVIAVEFSYRDFSRPVQFPRDGAAPYNPSRFQDASRLVSITRRRLLGLLAGSAAAIGVPTIWISRMKTYDGPVSDHFDGMHFFDPDGSPPKSLGEVLRWQFGGGRQRAAWPEWMPSPYADTPPPRV